MNSVIAWFSCGVTSAVAAKLTIQKYGERVELVYIDTSSEHPDNKRFLSDVALWLGRDIVILHSTKYGDIDDVFDRNRYLRGPQGARCTVEMKKKVRQDYQREGNKQIFGYHAKEKARAERFTRANPEIDLEYPLIDAGLDHDDCMTIILHAGIAIPIMYTLGFNNNNCIGCVKAEGAGYWNRTRLHFPDVFDRRARQERKLGYALVRQEKTPVFLDELNPTCGLDKQEPAIQCGLLCDIPITE